ncbi:hypothetical protein Agabi119p4_7719 [Agaricus bisporus var. burnettii]|uniref:Reverse transcriptase Ty1/copia-type domain-containing protein n=1 Tax=Agaricus bisporus var. burnettii TaxID=192524 RepID=A0A8H7C7S4_AGABI|nr:hypothetical protein Agabi119p4_7719 [Agaricus bisporus var. burnettii]
MTSAVTELSKHFKLRDLGSTTLLLGIQVKQDRSHHTISLSQEHYIKELLERFNMDDADPLSTPLAPGSELSDIIPSLEDQAEMKSVPYLNAVGALQYLATMTRPDIAYAVSYLGRACKATGRATGGYVTLVSGAAVGWSSKRQPFVTLSSTEAEFVAAVEAGKEIKWTRNILTEFGFPLTLPSTLFVDNKSGISVAKNPEHHGRMKHLDLRFYWLREAVKEGLIDSLYVSTHEQVADIFTKAVAKKVVEFAVPLLGLE